MKLGGDGVDGGRVTTRGLLDRFPEGLDQRGGHGQGQVKKARTRDVEQLVWRAF